MTIRSFKNKETEAIAHGGKNKRTLRILPGELHYAAYKKMVYLDNIKTLESLKAWRGLQLEKLSGDRKGQLSIRINDQYRICFRFQGSDVLDVEIVDYH
ncbi:MAG: plasmid maintenance system killer protein [Proteobacteria bacterium]|nr:MAG: plasmid maintenance system killer protein [Pseudomonadota bacterium]